jgi:hypothetical protein
MTVNTLLQSSSALPVRHLFLPSQQVNDAFQHAQVVPMNNFYMILVYKAILRDSHIIHMFRETRVYCRLPVAATMIVEFILPIYAGSP